MDSQYHNGPSAVDGHLYSSGSARQKYVPLGERSYLEQFELHSRRQSVLQISTGEALIAGAQALNFAKALFKLGCAVSKQASIDQQTIPGPGRARINGFKYYRDTDLIIESFHDRTVYLPQNGSDSPGIIPERSRTLQQDLPRSVCMRQDVLDHVLSYQAPGPHLGVK